MDNEKQKARLDKDNNLIENKNDYWLTNIFSIGEKSILENSKDNIGLQIRTI